MRSIVCSAIMAIILSSLAIAEEDVLEDLQERPAQAIADMPKLSPLLVDDEGHVVATKGGWKRRREALMKRWRAFMGEFPETRAPLKAQVIATEDAGDFTRQYVRYQIEEGVFTDGYLLTPKKLKGKLPGVVVFHQTVATQAKQVAGVDQSNPELMQGVQLVRRGYVALCPRCFIFDEGADYAGNVRKMETLHPNWKGMARMTHDGVRAMDYLASLPNVDGGRIGCIGHSLGAKEALYAAAFDERYRVAVFSEGGIGLRFSNWEAPWYLGPDINQPDFKMENHEVIALIAPRPFLLLAGDSADSDKSWAFVDAVMPVYRLLGAPNHIGWWNHRSGHRYPPRARAVAEAFLDRFLK